jgi:hypothetical protein
LQDFAMVAAVSQNPSVLQPKQPSKSSTPTTTTPQSAFQQSVSHYLQNTTSGVGGPSGAATGGANPSQTLSGDLMSTLLQMQH